MKQRVLYVFPRIFSFLGLVILLSSCAIADFPADSDCDCEGPSAPANARTPDFDVLQLEGNCVQDPQLLETWLGSAMSIRQNLANVLARATQASSPDDLRTDRAAVQVMLEGVRGLVAPDCTQLAHRELYETLSIAENLLDQYIDGERSELGSEVEQLLIRLDTVGRMQESLLTNFEPTAPTATPEATAEAE